MSDTPFIDPRLLFRSLSALETSDPIAEKPRAVNPATQKAKAELLSAIRAKNTSKLEQLLASGMSVNFLHPSASRSALGHALSEGWEQGALMLIKAGASDGKLPPEALSPQHQHAITLAASAHPLVLEALWEVEPPAIQQLAFDSVSHFGSLQFLLPKVSNPTHASHLLGRLAGLSGSVKREDQKPYLEIASRSLLSNGHYAHAVKLATHAQGLYDLAAYCDSLPLLRALASLQALPWNHNGAQRALRFEEFHRAAGLGYNKQGEIGDLPPLGPKSFHLREKTQISSYGNPNQSESVLLWRKTRVEESISMPAYFALQGAHHCLTAILNACPDYRPSEDASLRKIAPILGAQVLRALAKSGLDLAGFHDESGRTPLHGYLLLAQKGKLALEELGRLCPEWMDTRDAEGRTPSEQLIFMRDSKKPFGFYAEDYPPLLAQLESAGLKSMMSKPKKNAHSPARPRSL